MSWLSRNAIIYGCIAVASTASVLYLIQRRRKKPQLAALTEEASDLNYFMDSNQDSSFNKGTLENSNAEEDFFSFPFFQASVRILLLQLHIYHRKKLKIVRGITG
jgi:hypothetical protein